jgi:hypothetical protein
MLLFVRISPRTEGKDSNYFYNNKTILYFSKKKHGIAPVPLISDCDFTSLDVEASDITIAIPEVHILTSNQT